MRNIVSTFLVASLLSVGGFAKNTQTKVKKDVSKIKKEKIAKLEAKKEVIEKRISCIKKAKTSTEIKQCEKKYPLVKRGKKNKKAKKMKKKKNKK